MTATFAPLPPVRCPCGAVADVMDDETGTPLCARCWLELESER